jgi:hypothetical protein
LQGKSQRKIFPTQAIKETKPDGSLIVQFKVGNYGEIRDMIKAWLPDIRILAPEQLGKRLADEMNRWMAWQAGSLSEALLITEVLIIASLIWSYPSLLRLSNPSQAAF